MKLSVVTALYNCLDHTKAFLNSLEHSCFGRNYEVILVDDGSTDGTRDFLRTLNSKFRVIEMPENGGYAKANNVGARAAQGEVLVFLNNDIILLPGWLEPMLAALKHLPDAGLIGNIQINAKNGLVDHCGVFFDWNGLPRQAGKNRKLLPATAHTEWNAVTAACFIMRRQDFLDLDGFDEGYRNGMEDIDLCVRARLAGHRIYTANRSHLYHHVSSSPGRLLNNAGNTALFAEKWQSLTRVWGEGEWPREYLRRYGRHWWRANPRRAWRAFQQLKQSPAHAPAQG
jgi:GT2 family glycosyltransferase